jgi:hypothetical protein
MKIKEPQLMQTFRIYQVLLFQSITTILGNSYPREPKLEYG